MVVGLKLISGSFWAFGIGAAAGIAATLDPNATLFHTTMDQLNFYLRERKLPKAMRIMCREYFTNAREVHQVNDDSSLLGQMTPRLLSIVAIAANKRWLDHVWFLRDLGSTGEEQEFIARLLSACASPRSSSTRPFRLAASSSFERASLSSTGGSSEPGRSSARTHSYRTSPSS